MFLRNRVTGEVHDVPDHLVHGFHTAQEVDGFGEPLGLPFLAALAPMLTNILPMIGGLFKGGDSAPAPPPPPPAPVQMSPPPPPPPPPMEMPPEPILPPRRIRVDRGPDDDGPRADVKDPNGMPPGRVPNPVYRLKRRVRRRKPRGLRPQVNGYGWWY